VTIRLDHTIVPAKDKMASAGPSPRSFKPGHFAQVQANESLSFDLADEPEPWGGPGFDPGTAQSHHHGFHVSATSARRSSTRSSAG
jgi:hypothetical protein